jgi:hypothetical protein
MYYTLVGFARIFFMGDSGCLDGKLADYRPVSAGELLPLILTGYTYGYFREGLRQ